MKLETTVARVLVIDFASAFNNLREERGNLWGEVIPSLPAAIKRELFNGSTIYFLTGRARDPMYRSRVENLLERSGISQVFVSPTVPDNFDAFVTRKLLRIEDL